MTEPTSQSSAVPVPDTPDSRRELARKLDRSLEGSEAAALALRFAALSAQFDPDDALTAAGLAGHVPGLPSEETLKRLAVISQLADVCDTRLSASHWSMRSAPRSRLLSSKSGSLEGLVAWRMQQKPLDDPARDICDALLGVGHYSVDSVRLEIASGAHDASHIERLVRAISLAKPIAPATSCLPALQASLALARWHDDPEHDLLAGGFYGREEQLAQIAETAERQWSTVGAGALMTYVGGMGGVGKSTLLAEARRRARAGGAVCVSLDFDRPGIEGGRPLHLAREVARQIIEQLGAQAAILYGLIIESSRFSGRSRSEKVEAGNLLPRIGGVLRDAGKRLLLSLDTMESLTLHGESAARELLDWLRELRRSVGRVAIVAAGRETLPLALAHDAHPILLKGLPDEAARRLLEDRGVGGGRAEDLISLARGNPLVLRLGLRLVSGDHALERSLQSRGISREASAAVKAGQLYRLILSRIPSEELRVVAHPGLLLRQINVRMLLEVVAPSVGLADLEPKRAQDLLDQLALHAWLVESHHGWLVHRPELRLILLDLQIEERPERARRVFAKAAAWHRRNGQPELELYYRLQATRWTSRLPVIDPELAFRFTAAMIDELPRIARDALSIARGERSSRFREEEVPLAHVHDLADRVQTAQSDPDPSLNPSVLEELRGLLNRRNFAEAASMISHVRDFSSLDLADSASNAAIEALWRLGDWGTASELLRRRMSLAEDALGTGWEDGALVAAFADLLPSDFRRRLRTDLHFGDIAQSQAKRFEDDPDWDVVGLLLAAGGRPPGSNLVRTVWAMWTGPAPSDGDIATICQQLSSTLDFGRLSDSVQGLPGLIRALTPDRCRSQILQNKLQAIPELQQQLVAPLAVATLNALARNPTATSDMSVAASFVIDRVDSVGGLPHLATALAVLEPSLALRRIAKLSRRRAATIAGRWSFGPPPEGWRQGATDWITDRALSSYGPAPHEAQAQARRDLELWSHGYGSNPPLHFDRLLRRAQSIADSTPVPLFGDRSAALRTIAQSMSDRGMPLALVPPFAILVQADSPLAPRPV